MIFNIYAKLKQISNISTIMHFIHVALLFVIRINGPQILICEYIENEV